MESIFRQPRKTILGLVGERGSGKGTFASVVSQVLGPDVAHFRFSTVLSETLRIWGLPHTTENLQKIANAVAQQFGEAALAEALKKRVVQCTARVVIIDGVRRVPDELLVRSFPEAKLVYITAPLSARHNRVQNRQEKSDDQHALELFVTIGQAANESLIPEIGKRADHTLLNEGTFDDFVQAIGRFIQSEIGSS